jgi:hypothetical protein
VPATVRALLTGLIDYAGLFPPASLPMRDVVRNYAAYLASPHAWMLGRLVIPADRLDELARCRPERSEGPAFVSPWRISAIYGVIPSNVEESAPHACVVDSCEIKATSTEDISRIAAVIPKSITTFVEIPVATDPSVLLDAIAKHGLNAKIRTGGVTADAFPSSAHVARFIIGCAERKLAFKATAGLHHPLRGKYKLTYANDAPSGTMYGFLNVFLAAIHAQRGEYDRVQQTLESTDTTALDIEQFDAADVAASRNRFAISFGSCSFTEPVDDLTHLGIL